MGGIQIYGYSSHAVVCKCYPCQLFQRLCRDKQSRSLGNDVGTSIHWRGRTIGSFPVVGSISQGPGFVASFDSLWVMIASGLTENFLPHCSFSVALPGIYQMCKKWITSSWILLAISIFSPGAITRFSIMQQEMHPLWLKWCPLWDGGVPSHLSSVQMLGCMANIVQTVHAAWETISLVAHVEQR